MTRSGRVAIPEFRRKIDLARAVLRLKSDNDFAKLIGVEPTTLSGYLGRHSNDSDAVPQARLAVMATVLAERLSDRLTPQQAELAWQSDFDTFLLALAPRVHTAFGRLIERTQATLGLSIHLMPEAFGAVDDGVGSKAHAQAVPAEANFKLEVRGPRRAFLIAFVQSAQGWHFVAPREPHAIRIGRDGLVRAPDKYLRFLKDGGVHTFYAFAIDAAQPPGLIARAEHRTPLTDDELNAFAAELQNTGQTKSFRMGRLAVFVDPANGREARAPRLEVVPSSRPARRRPY